MRILYITGNIEERYGGPGTTTIKLCDEFNKLGHKCDLLTFDVEDIYLNNIKKKYNFKIFNIKTFIIKEFLGGFGLNFPIFILHNIKCYDIIFVNSIWGFLDFILLVLNKYYKKHVILVPHGCLDSFVFKGTKKKLYTSVIQSSLVKLSNPYFYALTNKEKKDIIDTFPYIKSDKVIVAPNGVYIEKIKESKNDLRKKYNIPEDKKIFLYLGRFHYKKNIENTILAFNEYNKNKKAILILHGDENNFYCKLKSKYESEEVLFKGYIKGKEKFEVFKSSDIFLLISYSEGLPMAVLEAIGMGCKVIISKECNIEDVEKHKIGIYSKHDIISIKNSMNQINLTSNYNSNINEFMEKYRWETTANNLIKFCFKILEKKILKIN